MELEHLLDCVATRSVIRLQVDLTPASPDGLVCPPTYAAPKKGEPPHIPYRRAYIDGQQRDAVVLDSPQSQSNRIELALLAAVRAKHIRYPDIEITFPGLVGEPAYSVLQLSHRIYDAVMRTVTLDKQPFFETPIGRALLAARPDKACALLEHAPICLTLGAWDSNGGGGPLSAKIPRLLTSEILGLDAVPADISATKFDPMDIRSHVAELMPTDDPVQRFTIRTAATKSKEKGKKPSEMGFGSVPATAVPRAAVISGAVQTAVLSCSGLRHLHFPDAAGQLDPRRDQAARALLAAWTLYGLVAQNETGYLLRSRCELLPRDAGRLELIGRTLQERQEVSLQADTALALLDAAWRHAAECGLALRDIPLKLAADERLVELVRRSRAAVAQSDGADEE